MKESSLRTNYRNIWCVLRSIDMGEVEFSDPARAEEWKMYRWAKFRDDPHSYFIRCEPAVADAIWEAVEKRLDGWETVKAWTREAVEKRL